MTNWINVKDRMPEKDGRYLVVEVFASDLSFWIGVCSLRQGKWDSSQVIKWQPLPELPEDLKCD